MILLVIDVQKGITHDRLYAYERFIENTTAIIETARHNNIEVIYVRHDDGPGTGFSVGDIDYEIADQVKPMPGEKIYSKSINSCFGNKELAAYLEKKGDNTLVIVGLQTDFCIDASIKSARERGYHVIVPEGTNSTFDNDYMDKETTFRYFNEMMWPKRYASCVSMEEAIKWMEQEGKNGK